MKKKVILVNPPQLNSLDDRLDPPLGLMYIASVMEKNSVDVEICDLASKTEEQWPNLISDADIYGITLFSASFNTAKRISRVIKSKNKNAIIVAGGPHATSMCEETLESKNFDYVIKGEGEFSFLQFVNNFYNSKKNSKIIKSEMVSDINSLPIPARHLIDFSTYTREVDGEKATSLITSRGCPNNCSFCCKDIHGKKVRFRSVDSVINEVKEIKSKYNIHSFLFYDDIFTLNRKRLSSLCNKLKELNINFRCNGRAGINTFEDYQNLYKAGCREIAFGIESGNQLILNKVNKGTTVQQNIESIQNAKKAGLITKAYLIVGYPGETRETINDTKKFIDIANPDKFTVFMFVPLPGCDVWKYPEKYGITYLSKDWDQYFNIAGQYEGGITFKTKDLDSNKIKELHDDLVSYLLNRKENYGQRGNLQNYYDKLFLNPRKE